MSRSALQPLIRYASAAILAIVLALQAVPAFADAPANSIVQIGVFKDSYCINGDGYTDCYNNMAVVDQITTPSGNITFMGNGSSAFTEWNASGTVVYHDSLKYHTEGLMNIDYVLRQFGQFFTYTQTLGTTTCTIVYQFHLVGDQIQFDRSTTCS